MVFVEKLDFEWILMIKFPELTSSQHCLSHTGFVGVGIAEKKHEHNFCTETTSKYISCGHWFLAHIMKYQVNKGNLKVINVKNSFCLKKIT